MLMKNMFVVLLMLFAILHNVFAEIKNGYEKDIEQIRISLHVLYDILSGNPEMKAKEKRRINQHIGSLTEYLLYYDVTSGLLERFKDISPVLYAEVDGLLDSKGRSVDVYVKFRPLEDAASDIPGIVSFYPSGPDRSGCRSEFGYGSVSVEVWLSNNALSVLSHEFGHLTYIVPNLSTYLPFYKQAEYSHCNSSSFGHSAGDMSGLNALRFEKRFRISYADYRKDNANQSLSPLAVLNICKRNIVERHRGPALAAHSWSPGYGVNDRRLP
jgi:hypothetical protein